MKIRTIAALILMSVLITGCSKSIDEDQLQNRGGLYYQVNVTTPYTGRVTSHYRDGQMESETSYADGKKHGEFKEWHKNGQLESEGSYADGKKHGEFKEWHKNGNKRAEGHYIDGEIDGNAYGWEVGGRKTYESVWNEEKGYRRTIRWQGGGKTLESIQVDGKEYTTEYGFSDYRKSETYTKVDGKYHGIYTRFRYNGTVKQKLEYANGKVIKVID